MDETSSRGLSSIATMVGLGSPPDEQAGPSLIRAMLVDRNAMVRMGLKSALACLAEVSVVAEASGGPLALQVCRNYQIDLAIVGLPGDTVDLVDFVTALKQTRETVRVLCGIDHPSDAEAADLVRAGVDGIVDRNAVPDDFVFAVRTILRGHSCMPKAVTERLARSEGGTRVPEAGGLTLREIEVLRYIADGFSNKDIARRMDLSVRTVECHRLNLRRKTGMLRPKDLVGFAQRMGLRDRIAPPEAFPSADTPESLADLSKGACLD